MPEQKPWAFPDRLQPQRTELEFDLESALSAVVLLHAEVPEDAFTASLLGTERLGSGTLIRYQDQEYVLTIGYLITEAESIWLTTLDGRVVAGHPFAYDQTTGFGLVLPLGRLNLPALQFGPTEGLRTGDRVIVISNGGITHALDATLIAKREFAGYWEYLLDQALFTAPPHPHWSGAALLDRQGRLIGVGSLLAQEEVSGETFDANMFVPIDLLQPLLAEMIQFGQAVREPRPWLGVHAAEQDNQVLVAGLTATGPGERSGLRPGDVILEVNGQMVGGLPEFLRAVWSLGAAGVEVPLTVLRKRRTLQVQVRSASRQDFLKKPAQH